MDVTQDVQADDAISLFKRAVRQEGGKTASFGHNGSHRKLFQGFGGPPSFRSHLTAILRHAWGIWRTAHAPPTWFPFFPFRFSLPLALPLFTTRESALLKVWRAQAVLELRSSRDATLYFYLKLAPQCRDTLERRHGRRRALGTIWRVLGREPRTL